MSDARRHRRILIAILAITLAVLAAPAVFVLLVDPFQVFHRHFLNKPAFLDGHERFQNVGLIRSYLGGNEGYQAIVLGTSMSQNFLSSRVEKDLQWGKTLRLTMSGGTPREIRYVAEAAIKTGNVRSVLWEVFTSYVGPDPEDLHDRSLFPVYLYNDEVWDDLRYVFSNGSVERAAQVLKGRYGSDLDRYSSWMDREVALGAFDKFSGDANLSSFARQLRDRRASAVPKGVTATHSFPQIDANLLPVVRTNPDVRFEIFFPPASTLNYALMPPGEFASVLAMRRYLLEQTTGMANVRLFAFDGESWITGDLGNYKDLVHYGIDINEFILGAISAGTHQLTPANLDEHLDRLIESVNGYKIHSTRSQVSLPDGNSRQ